MLSQQLVFRKSKNFTSDIEILMPPTVPINHYFSLRNQQNKTKVLFYYSMLIYSKHKLALSTLICSKQKAKVLIPLNQEQKDSSGGRTDQPVHTQSSRPVIPFRNPTTSFLTATTLIYAIGAGITAAAGTRLALQLILDKCFGLFSFHLQDLNKPCNAISCHYLLELRLGNLRACCLPWMWQPFLRLPLRNRTLILRYPSKPWQASILPSKVDRAEI
eukprot:TRINITY_DN2536_c0_g1_i1.p1 TRINITY_DN2536_c0_g1~~TRINITY_DN2536_c0_g1_i1.p1  ORF type:complete len:217 (+),score=-22.40 TRINITY_DN2536_c0_g1_i1:170-820(+)